jgi:hypothetical protein
MRAPRGRKKVCKVHEVEAAKPMLTEQKTLVSRKKERMKAHELPVVWQVWQVLWVWRGASLVAATQRGNRH